MDNNQYDPNEKYFDKPTLCSRIYTRVTTKQGYKYVAQFIGLAALMTVTYYGLIVIAAAMDAL